MAAHPIRWQAPQPLWARFATADGTVPIAAAPEQARPAILRFATDDFMEQILATLARNPARIDRLVARHETWRKPMEEAPDLVERAALPRVAQSSARAAATLRPKSVLLPAPAGAPPLKLYQSAHQRYYLVSASLVCAVQGLPERAVTARDTEQLNFVIRRLLPVPGQGGATVLREFSYLKDAKGARWQRCSDGPDDSAPVADEERLPLFPLTYQDDRGNPRTLWSGLVPVGRREEYLGAKVEQNPVPRFADAQRASLTVVEPVARQSRQARTAQFQFDVAEPWKTLIRSAHKATLTLDEDSPIDGDGEDPADTRTRIFEFNLQQQTASWLVLLDLADHIATHLPDLWSTIEADGSGLAALSEPRQHLYSFLGSATMSAPLTLALRATDLSAEIRPPSANMRVALKAIRAAGVREKLEAITITYGKDSASLNLADWPPFHFVLAGLNTAGSADGPFAALAALSAPGANADVAADPLAGPVPGQSIAQQVDRLTALYRQALELTSEREAPPLPFALQVQSALLANVGDLNDGGWFVVRFVHTRRDCGPLHPPLLSAPTERFKLAGFFDADAPARPIRISLPVDTSPAGLRKFNRNTAFVMSDMLCGQVQRAKGLGLGDLIRSVLPWPLHKSLDLGAGGPCQSGGINVGMICSLSIPIITICALLLLMIIVSLLDLIFRWLPYFVFCFPIPGFKGKRNGA
jgi:hypothetical protein